MMDVNSDDKIGLEEIIFGLDQISSASLIEAISIVPPDNVVVNRLGQRLHFGATAVTDSGSVLTGISYYWNSNNPQVARVDENCVVTALSIGQATIEVVAPGRPEKNDSFVLVVHSAVPSDEGYM